MRTRYGKGCAATALALCGAAAPVMAQSPPALINDYNLIGFFPPQEARLSSYVDCGYLRCDIGYSIVTKSVDRYVQVVWKDINGAPLVSGTNAYLSNFWNPKDFGGYIEAVEWRKGVLGSAFLPSPAQAVGTADFTGTGSGSDPCGAGYVCNDADYYYWPTLNLKPPPPTGPTGATGSTRSTANAPQLLGTLTGTLSNVGILFDQPTDIGDRRAEFITFSSSVEFDNGLYRYLYSVTNFTDLTVPFEWSAAGLGGNLVPFATQVHEVTSAQAPDVVASLPAWTLRTDSQYPLVVEMSNALEIYAPVPEVAQWLQLVAGFTLLGATSAWRRSA